MSLVLVAVCCGTDVTRSIAVLVGFRVSFFFWLCGEISRRYVAPL